MTLEELEMRGYRFHVFRDRITIRFVEFKIATEHNKFINAVRWHPPISLERTRKIALADFVARRLEGKE